MVSRVSRVAKDEESVIKKAKPNKRIIRQQVEVGLAQVVRNENTPELEANGIQFLHDWLIDELPCWMRTKLGSIAAMPYPELNDANLDSSNNACDEMYKVKVTLDIFENEKQSNTKIMTLALHPHIVGVPQNFYYLKK